MKIDPLMYNQDGMEFSVGDYVYIANTWRYSSELYPVKVLSILEDEQTTGLGRHYVLLVSSNVDDYLTIEHYTHVWKSPEQRAAKAKEIIERTEKAYKNVRLP